MIEQLLIKQLGDGNRILRNIMAIIISGSIVGVMKDTNKFLFFLKVIFDL